MGKSSSYDYIGPIADHDFAGERNFAVVDNFSWIEYLVLGLFIFIEKYCIV